MSFIISRGFAEVQILKKKVNLTLSAFGTFWYAPVQILKKKSKTEKDITHLHMLIDWLLFYGASAQKGYIAPKSFTYVKKKKKKKCRHN